MEIENPHYILFHRGAPGDWRKAAPLLADAMAGVPRVSVIKEVRFGFGLVRLPLAQDVAEAAAAIMSANDFPASAIASEQIVLPPRPYTLMRVLPKDDGLYVQAGPGQADECVPWEAISILHVASVWTSNSSTMKMVTHNDSGEKAVEAAALSIGLSALSLAAGIPPGFKSVKALEKDARAKLTDAPKEEPEVLLEILIRKPLLRLRIRQKSFNYEYLAERRQMNARQNFALLLGDLRARATNAAYTGVFPLAIAGQRIEPERYGVDEGVFEKELTALLTRDAVCGLPRA
jgi:hypothetical protein